MQWYQIFGWVCVPLGALMAGPGVVKLVARPKSWRVPATLKGNTWTGLFLIFIGLTLVTGALWPVIANLVLLAASFLVWVYNFRARRQRAV